MFDVVFLGWALLVVTGGVLSVKGTRQGNARKRELGRRLLLVAGVSMLVGIGTMIYVVAVGST